MKLSEVKGERTLDVVASIIKPVCEIMRDDNVKNFMAKDLGENETPGQAFARKMQAYAPQLIADHKQSIIEILAAIEGVSPSEYMESLNLAKLFVDVTELMSDTTFTDFLASAAQSKGAEA